MTIQPRMARAATPTTTRPASRAWLPHQHGAWAMLAVPLLLGVAASQASAWQLLLGAAAVLGYLASAAAQAWLRARRRERVPVPAAAFGSAFAGLGVVLVIAFPRLLLGLVVLIPTAALVVSGAKPGTRRDAVNSLAQAAQALVLVPSAAWVSGAFEPSRVAIATGVAAAFLLGTVLVVRSALRARGSASFASVSIGFHAALVAPAMLVGGPAWTLLAVGMTGRAVLVALLARRFAGTPRALRPVHIGAIEAVASVAVVLVGFLALR